MPVVDALFTGTAGDEISVADSGFVRHPSYTPTLVTSNATRARYGGTGSGISAYYRTESIGSNDYSVTGFFRVLGTTNNPNIAVGARYSTSADSGYLARQQGSNIILYKNTAGTLLQLGTTVTRAVSIGVDYFIKIVVSGSTIEVWKDGDTSPSITATDSTYTTGAPLLRIGHGAAGSNTVGYHANEFIVDLLGGSTTIAVSDSGSGSESFGVAVTFSLADTATGSDAYGSTAAVPVDDLAAAVEALSAAVSLSVSDAATGSDALSVITATLIAVADTAAGNDSVGAVTVALNVTDNGTGGEGLALSVTVSVGDSGAGIDAAAAAAAISKAVDDAGYFVDSVSVIAGTIADARKVIFTVRRLRATFTKH